jgi:1-phosphofructokinase family hexose kinase
MIYTVTLDPLLERVVGVEELVYDDVNCITDENRRPGGRGIDVSRVVRELGGQSVALGFAGGYAGLEFTDMLDKEGIATDFVRISGETRSSITIYQRKKKIRTLLCTSSPVVGEDEAASFFDKVRGIPDGSCVVLSGTTAGLRDGIFAELISILKQKSIRTFLDSDHMPLRLGIDAGPFLIKPNIFELNRLAATRAKDVKEIAEAVKHFRDSVEYIVVSMGARGALGFSREGDYQVTPPKVKVRNSLGAGDSFMGGVVSVMSDSGSFEEALRAGVACGTATVLAVSGGLCRKTDVDSIKKEVIIEKF